MRHALGGDTRASHADALAHYSAAAALAPSRLTHWSEHGKALVALGRPGEGALLLRTALGCDVEDVNAEVARVHAAALLQQLKAGRRDGGRAQRRAAQAERRVAARAARAARREEARGRREARRAARGSQRSAAAAV